MEGEVVGIDCGRRSYCRCKMGMRGCGWVEVGLWVTTNKAIEEDALVVVRFLRPRRNSGSEKEREEG